MKRIGVVLLTLVLIFTNNPVYAFNNNNIVSIMDKESLTTAIIELEDSPILEGVDMPLEDLSEYLTSEKSNEQKEILIEKQKKVKANINLLVGRQVEYTYSYTNAFNGFSARLTYIEIEKIKELKEINNVNEAQTYRAQDITYETQNTGVLGSKINTPDIAFKGEGKVVAVIDSGIKYTHPDFRISDKGKIRLTKSEISNLLNSKYIKATSIGSNYKVDSYYINEKFPFAFDYADKDNDTTPIDSHGTHVAGIAAANSASEGGIIGIAPEAQIISMKVFSDRDNQASDEDIIAAIEDSISLGVNVINLSLGYSTGVVSNESSERFEKIFSYAQNSGIAVVCAAGNESKVGTIDNITYKYTLAANPDSGLISYPASLNSTLAVASSNGTSLVMPYFILSNNKKIYYTDSSELADVDSFDTIFDGKQIGLVYVGLGTKEDYLGKRVTGKIAVIDRGIYSFNEKVLTAEQQGAVGVIIVNYDSEKLLMLLSDINIPAVLVATEFKEDIMQVINNTANPNIMVTQNAAGIVSVADSISKFSSSGVTADLNLKPDITAPGEQIISTENKYLTGSQSGTSMSTPQISGALMVIDQYLGSIVHKVDENVISKLQLSKMLLMSSAKIVTDFDNNQTSPRQQGAGILDVEAATKTGAFLYNKSTKATKLELGNKLANNSSNKFSMSVTIRNITAKTLNYNLITSLLTSALFTEKDGQVYSMDKQHRLSESKINIRGNSKNINKYSTNGTKEIITLSAYEEKTIILDVVLDKKDIEYLKKSINGTFIEGFIECIPSDKDMPIISIPYMGFYGDWDQVPIFDASVYDVETPYFSGQRAISSNQGNQIVLGTNSYLSEGEAIYDYDLIAISPNSDEKNESMEVEASYLRDIRLSETNIINDKGEIVRKWIMYENFPKTQISIYEGSNETIGLGRFDGTDYNYNILPEGNYTYVAKAELQVQRKVVDTWEIPFVIDLSSPIIQDYEIVTKEGIQTLNLSVKDNHYIQAIIVKDQYENTLSQLAITQKFNPNQTFQVSIPLINRKGDIIQVSVIDYANNELKQVIKGPTPPALNLKIVKDKDGKNGIDLTQYSSQIVQSNSMYINLETASIINTIIKNSVDYVQIELGKQNKNENIIDLSQEVIKALKSKNLDMYILHNELTYEIPIETLAQTSEKVKIAINKNVSATIISPYKQIGFNYQIKMFRDGTRINHVSNKIIAKVYLGSTTNEMDRISNFIYQDGKTLVPNMTYLNDNTVKFRMSELGQHSLLIYEKKFADVNGGWAQKYINSLSSKNIIKGTSNTTFSPLNTISRAEFVAMVVRTIDSDMEAKVDFIGMDKKAWYYQEMILAKQLGLIEGDTYDALAKINRFEMAMVAARAHAIINEKQVDFSGKLSFTDVSGDSMSKYIGYAKENGLISGYVDNTFKPANNATREEITRVIYGIIVN